MSLSDVHADFVPFSCSELFVSAVGRAAKTTRLWICHVQDVDPRLHSEESYSENNQISNELPLDVQTDDLSSKMIFIKTVMAAVGLDPDAGRQNKNGLLNEQNENYLQTSRSTRRRTGAVLRNGLRRAEGAWQHLG